MGDPDALSKPAQAQFAFGKQGGQFFSERPDGKASRAGGHSITLLPHRGSDVPEGGRVMVGSGIRRR